jgi:hypothetical protein
MMGVLLPAVLTSGQGFIPPEEGNAVVYFARVSGYQAANSFDFFHYDKFIGDFKGKNYLRYECGPGEQLFWASGENEEFLTAELESGAIYIVIVEVMSGTWKAFVGLQPVNVENAKRFGKARELISKKPPVEILQEDLEKGNKKKRKYIEEKLKKYKEKWSKKREYSHISPDWAIPPEMIK